MVSPPPVCTPKSADSTALLASTALPAIVPQTTISDPCSDLCNAIRKVIPRTITMSQETITDLIPGGLEAVTVTVIIPELIGLNKRIDEGLAVDPPSGQRPGPESRGRIPQPSPGELM